MKFRSPLLVLYFSLVVQATLAQTPGCTDIGAANYDYYQTATEDDGSCLYLSLVTNSPIVDETSRSVGGSWGDYDNDGWLDLFVANTDYTNDFLYNNNGDGTFTKITAGDLVNDGKSTIMGAWGDYDNDGDLDIYVAYYDNYDNRLFKNNGDGTFATITTGDFVDDGVTHVVLLGQIMIMMGISIYL